MILDAGIGNNINLHISIAMFIGTCLHIHIATGPPYLFSYFVKVFMTMCIVRGFLYIVS